MLLSHAGPPHIEIDPHLRNGVKVTAGTTVRLHVGIFGKPDPNVAWSRDGNDVKDNFHSSIDNSSPHHSTLLIKSVSKLDSGPYTITAANTCGKKTAVIKLLVSGIWNTDFGKFYPYQKLFCQFCRQVRASNRASSVF